MNERISMSDADIRELAIDGATIHEKAKATDFKEIIVSDPDNPGLGEASFTLGHLPGEGRDTLIRLMPIGEYPQREFEMQRMAHLNLTTGIEIVSISGPNNMLPVRLRQDLTQAHPMINRLSVPSEYRSKGKVSQDYSTFHTLGKLLGHALEEYTASSTSPIAGSKKDGKVIVDAYSLGANIAGGFLAGISPEHSLYPDTVILREVADKLKRVSLGSLVVQFVMHGGDKQPDYNRFNQEYNITAKKETPLSAIKLLGRYPIKHLMMATGIAGGSLLPDIHEAHSSDRLTKDVKFVVARGSDSVVFPEEIYEQLTSDLRQKLGKRVIQAVAIEGATHAHQNHILLNTKVIRDIVESQ